MSVCTHYHIAWNADPEQTLMTTIGETPSWGECKNCHQLFVISIPEKKL